MLKLITIFLFKEFKRLRHKQIEERSSMNTDSVRNYDKKMLLTDVMAQ